MVLTKNEALLLFSLNPFYTEEELKDKWHFLVKRYHPDHGNNPEYFKRLVVAHQVLIEHREKHSAKQEWFDYVSKENQPNKHKPEKNDFYDYYNLFPAISTIAVSLSVLAVLNNYYMSDYLKHLYDIQLMVSAASGKLIYAMSSKSL